MKFYKSSGHGKPKPHLLYPFLLLFISVRSLMFWIDFSCRFRSLLFVCLEYSNVLPKIIFVILHSLIVVQLTTSFPFFYFTLFIPWLMIFTFLWLFLLFIEYLKPYQNHRYRWAMKERDHHFCQQNHNSILKYSRRKKVETHSMTVWYLYTYINGNW